MMISKEEWKEICLSLLDHHSLFYKIGEMGVPILTDSVPTACVTFDKSGKYINFLFNPNFWEKSSLYEKVFVVCHEALHIILNHGSRFKDSKNPQISNVAMDVVVNHILVNRFGFDRNSIKMADELCWIDTVFADELANGKIISDDETAEYYLNIINKNKNQDSLHSLRIVDTHGDDNSDSKFVFDKINEELTQEEKNSIKSVYDKHSEKKLAGKNSESHIHFASQEQIKPKKRWETVVNKWAKKTLKNTDHDLEQWAKKHRRHVCLGTDLFLPSDTEVEDLYLEKNKIEVFFYLDTSGSCWHLKDRFFSVAESLPTKYFSVKLFCFDTVVSTTDIETRKMRGGGGTSFRIIEEHIQKTTKENNTNYPDSVWVLTDLYGDKVVPKFPERWHWFVDLHTEQTMNSIRNEYVPQECKLFLLRDFI